MTIPQVSVQSITSHAQTIIISLTTPSPSPIPMPSPSPSPSPVMVMVFSIIMDSYPLFLPSYIFSINYYPPGGVDFAPLSMNLTISAEGTVNHEVCFQFTIIGDNQEEGNEGFSIILTPITPDIIVGESVVNVMIIEDNDGKPPSP